MMGVVLAEEWKLDKVGFFLVLVSMVLTLPESVSALSMDCLIQE